MTSSIANNLDEVDNAKRIYNDINDYLDLLADVLQTEAEESDEPISPNVSKFLEEYREYVSSNVPLSSSPKSYSPISDASNFSKKKSKRLSLYKPNLWKYSLMCEKNDSSKMPPESFKRFSLPTTASLSEIDLDKQGFAMFSNSLPKIQSDTENDERNTDNNNSASISPSIQLLKQLDSKLDQPIVKVDKSPVSKFLTATLGENLSNFFGNNNNLNADQVESEKSNKVSTPDNNREVVTQTKEPISLFQILLSLAKIGNISRTDYLSSCVRWDHLDR